MSQFDYSGLCIKQQILAKLAAINMTLNRDPSVFHSEGNLPLNEQIIHAYTQSTVIKLNRILNEREVDLFNNLNLYLSENWALIKGTCLSYTALPEHPITDLLCDVATWTAKIGRDLLPIKLLMPTICIDHAVTDEKNFTAKTDLRVILKTHILGRASHYLIPVNVLTTLPITFNASKIGNPYFDADVHPLESEYWDVDELERLSRHSSFSASIFDLKKQYDDLSQDNSHLFGRISELVRLLTYNSSHGGVGTEEIAGKGAMIAIVDFFEYYDRFADEEKLCIPGAVLRELNLLRDYSVPEADRQIKNLHPLHSCIGTRSVDLLNAMKGVESVLSNITLVGHTKTTLLDKVLRNFNGSKTSLAENLSGNDTLGITKDVIETLNIKLRLQSYDDLKILYQLTAPEIIELCTITGVPEMIVQAIEHIENLVCIFHDLPHEKIMALLRGTGSVLIQSLIRSAKNDLLPLLISLDNEKIKIVFLAMEEQSIAPFQSVSELKDVLIFLSETQRNAVFIAVKNQFHDVIHSSNNFWALMHDLSNELRNLVYEAMQHKLPSFIKTMNDCDDVMRCLSETQCAAVYQKMGTNLIHLIESGNNLRDSSGHFNFLLRHLPEEQVTEICDMMKERLPVIFNTSTQLTSGLRSLSNTKCSIVFEAIKEWIPTLIHSSQCFDSLLMHFSAAERTLIYMDIKERIPNFIVCARDFMFALRYLSEAQRIEVYAIMKARLPNMIVSVTDYKNVLEYLSEAQRWEMCEAKKESIVDLTFSDTWEFTHLLRLVFEDHGPDVFKFVDPLIHSSTTLHEVLAHSSETQVESLLCSDIRHRLPLIVKSPADLNLVLKGLSEKNSALMIKTLENNLHLIITSIDGYAVALHELELAQVLPFIQALEKWIAVSTQSIGDFFYLIRPLLRSYYSSNSDELMKQHLCSLIQSPRDFFAIRNILPEVHQEEIYETMKSTLPDRIDSLYNFREALSLFSESPYVDVYEVIKNKHLTLIHSADDLAWLLTELTEVQCAEICRDVVNRIPNFIQSVSHFVAARKDLSPGKRTIVYESMKGQLFTLIHSGQDFAMTINDLSESEGKKFYDGMSERLPSLVHSADDFDSILSSLRQPQRTAFFKKMAKTLPQYIQSFRDLDRVCFNLLEQENTMVYEAIKSKLPEMIHSPKNLYFSRSYLEEEQYELLKKKLPEMIRSLGDIKFAWNCLSKAEIEIIFGPIFHQYLPMFGNPNDIIALLNNLPEEKIHLLFKFTGKELISTIDPKFDIPYIMASLFKEHALASFYEAIKNDMSTFFPSAKIFLTYFTAQRSPQNFK